MKPRIHPTYLPVVYRDKRADLAILTRSTKTSTEMSVWDDGNTYPVVDVEVSSASHPFYTVKAHVVDTAGWIERFQPVVRRDTRGPRRSGPTSTATPRHRQARGHPRVSRSAGRAADR